MQENLLNKICVSKCCFPFSNNFCGTKSARDVMFTNSYNLEALIILENASKSNCSKKKLVKSSFQKCSKYNFLKKKTAVLSSDQRKVIGQRP